MDYGILGGIIGTSVGIIGGLIGTYRSLKAAESRDERALIFWYSLIALTLVIGCSIGSYLLDPPYKQGAFIPLILFVAIGLPLFIRRMNRIRDHHFYKKSRSRN